MISSFLKRADKPIDYVGQAYATKLMLRIFAIGYALALGVGLIKGDLRYTLVLGILTCLIAFVACVPSWPYFHRNPLNFKKKVTKK
ncbi:signal peptidase complex subunit 1 [Pancytospora epiphaga]|nr:signal peptidase complex subunit 1 [Pancytospora epiphaga]